MSGEELARQSQDGVRSHVVLPTQECLFQFDSLPHIISRKVFSLLTFEELGKAALVCKQWYDRCRDPILWRRLSLNEHKLNVTDEVLVRLTSLSDVITHLDITECRKISANCVLECLRRCGFLEEMRAVRCRAFNDACLECLGQTSRGLRTIDMSLCPVSDEGVQKVRCDLALCTSKEYNRLEYYMYRTVTVLYLLSPPHGEMGAMQTDMSTSGLMSCQFASNLHYQINYVCSLLKTRRS